jgi:hypothetical protein
MKRSRSKSKKNSDAAATSLSSAIYEQAAESKRLQSLDPLTPRILEPFSPTNLEKFCSNESHGTK